jgi:hypothetical protein
MRLASTLLLTAALLSAGPVAAQQASPRKIGQFQGWTAATFIDAGQKVCYAFARPARSEGAPRSNVLLTVTHRPQARDTVTIAPGYTYPRNAEAMATIGAAELAFRAAGTFAAAQDGGAAVRSFRGGREAVLKGPGPNGRGQVVDAFALAGFGAAYDAISRECPAGARR